jgi:hypothetical protein
VEQFADCVVEKADNRKKNNKKNTDNVVQSVDCGKEEDEISDILEISGVDDILRDDYMQSRVEMLAGVENYIDLNVLQSAVERLIKAGKFSGVGDSDVIQFRKECTDINFGVWGNLVSARKKQEKASRVLELKNHIFNLMKTSHLIDATRICWDEVQVTALYTEPSRNKKQDPHTDYQLQTDDSTVDYAFTAHLPLNKVEGSHIYLWKKPGCGSAVHIPGGHCLLLRSDVVHSGGVPDSVGLGRAFIRLHFYLPTKSQKPPPLGETIYRTGHDGAYYFDTHWHSLKEKRLAALKIPFDKKKFLLKRSS